MLFGDKAAGEMGSTSSLSPVRERLDLGLFFGAVERSSVEMDFALGWMCRLIFSFLLSCGFLSKMSPVNPHLFRGADPYAEMLQLFAEELQEGLGHGLCLAAAESSMQLGQLVVSFLLEERKGKGCMQARRSSEQEQSQATISPRPV